MAFKHPAWCYKYREDQTTALSGMALDRLRTMASEDGSGLISSSFEMGELPKIRKFEFY